MLHVLTNFRNAPKYIRNPKLELIAKFSKFVNYYPNYEKFWKCAGETFYISIRNH